MVLPRMKSVIPVLFLGGLSFVFAADDLRLRAWQMESKGDAAAAREFLQRTSQSGTPDALEAADSQLDARNARWLER